LWLAVAGVASAHGDLHESIVAVTAEIEKSPQDGALYLRRAMLHAAHEDVRPAEADFARAEALKADASAIWLGRGRLQLAVGRLAEARATLDQLLAREPHHVEALVTRARARARLRDAEAAAADFTAAIAASGHPEPEYFLERAEVRASMEPPRYEEAIRSLDDGLKRLGEGVLTLQLAAIDLEVEAGRIEAALSRIDRVAATAVRKESWLTRRGDLLAGAGRTDEARRAYEQALAALAILPARARATRTMADLEMRIRMALAALAPAR